MNIPRTFGEELSDDKQGVDHHSLDHVGADDEDALGAKGQGLPNLLHFRLVPVALLHVVVEGVEYEGHPSPEGHQVAVDGREVDDPSPHHAPLHFHGSFFGVDPHH